VSAANALAYSAARSVTWKFNNLGFEEKNWGVAGKVLPVSASVCPSLPDYNQGVQVGPSLACPNLPKSAQVCIILTKALQVRLNQPKLGIRCISATKLKNFCINRAYSEVSRKAVRISFGYQMIFICNLIAKKYKQNITYFKLDLL
jgi:hypothetical protein